MRDETGANEVDLNRAYLLLRSMSHDGMESVAEESIARLIAAAEHPERLIRGLGAVINSLVEFVDGAYEVADADEPGDPDEPVHDHLHVFQPAIVSRLSRTDGLDPAAVALMAGVLTAASLGLDCYEWRLRIGPPTKAERAVWAITAFYLCDLIGHVGGDPDYALNIIGTAVAQSDST